MAGVRVYFGLAVLVVLLYLAQSVFATPQCSVSVDNSRYQYQLGIFYPTVRADPGVTLPYSDWGYCYDSRTLTLINGQYAIMKASLIKVFTLTFIPDSTAYATTYITYSGGFYSPFTDTVTLSGTVTIRLWGGIDVGGLTSGKNVWLSGGTSTVSSQISSSISATIYGGIYGVEYLADAYASLTSLNPSPPPSQYKLTVNVRRVDAGGNDLGALPGIKVTVGSSSYTTDSNGRVVVTLNQGSYNVGVTSTSQYKFWKWSDGSTSNPRTVSLTSDTTLTAYIWGAELDTGTNLGNASVIATATINGTKYSFNATRGDALLFGGLEVPAPMDTTPGLPVSKPFDAKFEYLENET